MKPETIEVYLQNIATCEKCSLSFIGKQKREKDYYYYGPNEFQQKYAILLQNPGESSQSHQEVNLSKMLQNPAAKFKKDAENLKDWFSANQGFFINFFDEFSKYCAKDKYYSETSNGKVEFQIETIFKNLHIFDLVKCKTETSNITKKALEECSFYLEDEINFLEKLELIFVVGSRAWSCFYKRFNCKILEENMYLNELVPVSKIHGKLLVCSWGKRTFYAIPLQHMAKQIYNNTLRNSYFDYLREGLGQFQRERLIMLG